MSVLAMQEDLYFVLDKIIGLLINGGADPNASFNGYDDLVETFGSTMVYILTLMAHGLTFIAYPHFALFSIVFHAFSIRQPL